MYLYLLGSDLRGRRRKVSEIVFRTIVKIDERRSNIEYIIHDI